MMNELSSPSLEGTLPNLHFIGIGGMGMGTLASLMLAKGCQVSGCDLKENQLTVQLRNQGAQIMIGHDPKHIENPDGVIYSSAVGFDNPELQEAQRKKIPVKKRAELLAELANAETAITVAGAHGKTTTTSMISHVFMKAGLKPTTAVGGIVNDPSYNAQLGAGKYFVAEVDESDGSFLFFRPYYSVITNIDFEHLDYYHNWDNILEAYRLFIRQTNPKGCLFVFGEDPRLLQLALEEKGQFLSYGIQPHNDLAAKNITLYGYEASCDCLLRGKNLGRLRLKVPGEHNILNALAAVAVGLHLGIDFFTLQEALSQYEGVQRRFQCQANIKDILVIEDYGHHPTEITATIKTARVFSQKRVIVVFQPHRYSRTQYLMDEFVESLSLSDYVVLTDIYAASEKPLAGVNSRELYDRIKKKKIRAVYRRKEEICCHLLKFVKPGDLVIFLGAGDINRVGEEFVKELQNNQIPNHKWFDFAHHPSNHPEQVEGQFTITNDQNSRHR